MTVRRRLPAGVAGFVGFVALGSVADPSFWGEPWFYIGLATVTSATFVEPFFSRPQDAIANAAGALVAVWAVERDPIQVLWLAFLAATVIVLCAGLVASVSTESSGTVKWISFRLSSRLGRAVVLGPAGLLLITLTKAARDETRFEFLAMATGVLVVALGVDWPMVLARVAQRPVPGILLRATGPRMVLLAASDDRHVGQRVRVVTTIGSSSGTITTKLPGQAGPQYRITLDSEWTAVAAGFPIDATLSADAEDGLVLGAAGDGTTELRVSFEPMRAASIGDPVSVRTDDGELLYQVATLRLISTTEGGSEALIPRATAYLVGWPEAGFIRGGTYLPRPHEPVFVAEIEQHLPPGYYEVGHIKGANIPIGFRIDDPRRGHLAVLGMTGMGKTAVAQRICRTLGNTNTVVALDTTGEYASRLGFPVFGNDLHAVGYSVYEPAGDPPERAAEFIERCMRAGHAEYVAGRELTSRVLLLEEAHTFVPEWNFSLRNQQDYVSRSTRMIMQARKFGVTFVIVSQRTAVVSKSALSQCENYIVLRTIDETSLDYLQTLVGSDLRDAISGLARFEAMCVGPAFNSETPVIITLTPP